MPRMAKGAKGRTARKSQILDLIRSNDASVDKDHETDRYHISASSSIRSEDSSHARGSENTSVLSRESSENDSSVGSSFETESDLSSLLELGADTEEIVDNGGIFSIRSYEAKPSMVGGWLDFACGWMDRPNMCVGLGGSKQTSLLQESSLKAAKAMRRVKLNETLKKATDSETVTQETKKKSDVEKIKRDVAKAAMVAAAAVKKHEIQPSAPLSEGFQVQDQQRRKNEPSKSLLVSDGHTSEDIEAKMKQVSARAAEILKNTIEARAIKSKEERDRSPPAKHSSAAHLRQKVIEKLTKEHEDSSFDNESDKKPEAVKSSTVSNYTAHLPREKDQIENSTRSSRSTHSIMAIKVVDMSVPVDEILDPEDTTDMAIEIPVTQDRDVHLVHDAGISESPSLEKVPVSQHKDEEITETEQISMVSASHSITDLTHFDDGRPEEDDGTGKGINDIDGDGYEPLPQPAVRADPPSSSPARLSVRLNNHVEKTNVEVIDVLELDDEDSWTPAEAIEPSTTFSASHGTHDTISDRLSHNRSPSKSNRASLFEGNVQRDESDLLYDWKKKDSLAARLEKRRAEKAEQDEAFNNDNDAREAFAGLRRGRLEIREMVHGSRSKSSRRQHDSHEALQASPPSKRRGEEENSFDLGLEAKNSSDIIATEVALRSARSRELRQQHDKTMETRRRTVDATTTASVTDESWRADSSTRRSRHLVAVRSIDEAQRMKTERSRDVAEPNNNFQSLSREKLEYAPYEYRSPSSRESPSEIPNHHEARRRHHEVSPLLERPSDQGYESRSKSQPAYDIDQDFLESRPSRDRRDQEMYSSAIINRSKSRESHYDYSEDLKVHRRGRDTRDDKDSRYNVGRKEASAQNRYDQFTESRSVHRERTALQHESDHMKELRRLEKKISKQLKHVTEDKYNSEDSVWDEHSAVSAKQLRHLEKKLAQSLRTEDEKRAAKLQRIRSKKTSNSRARVLEGGMEESRYDTRSAMLTHNPSVSSAEKDMDVQDSRSKYNQLKFLRQSGQMRKYMQRTGSQPEAY